MRLAQFLVGLIVWASVGSAAGPEVVQYESAKLRRGGELRYAVVRPTKFDPSKSYHTMVALPPGGQDESMVQAGLDRYWRDEAVRRGWVVISPIAPEGQQFQGERVELIAELITVVSQEVKCSGGKVHLAGVSNGGRSAFALAMKHPDLLHSLTVLPGAIDRIDQEALKRLKSVPTFMFVGENDDSWRRANDDLLEKMKKLGINATLEVLKGQGHVLDLSPERLFDLMETAEHQGAPALAKSRPVAVLELFTSEGCSSCPPADALLSTLLKNSRKGGVPIIAVAYHVDYWDYLGWKDRFASKEFSDRQRAYARVLGDRQTYTPQLVFNGTKGFVGSDRDRANYELRRAAEHPLPQDATMTAEVTKDRSQLRLHVSGAPGEADRTCTVLLVEDDLESKVTAGENSGRNLRHDAVVRALAETTLDAAGHAEVALKIPEDLKRRDASIVVILRAPKSLEVRAAAQIGLESLEK